jgi:hypothetical protein
MRLQGDHLILIVWAAIEYRVDLRFFYSLWTARLFNLSDMQTTSSYLTGHQNQKEKKKGVGWFQTRNDLILKVKSHAKATDATREIIRDI